MDNILFIIVGLGGLYFGGDWLVKGASRIAAAFHVSPLIIGLTIVSVGTSMPELVVSLQAALKGSAEIALGNVIGSNIANIGLILGACGLFSALAVHRSLVRREIPILVGVTLFASAMALDGEYTRLDGILLFGGFIAFNALFYFLSQNQPDAATNSESDVEALLTEKVSIKVEALRVLGGIGLLVVGSNFMVEGAVNIARAVGVNELVIGVTMVAFGTSLPELAASLTATFKGENDIAIGNVIGSNVANLLLILGVTVFFSPVTIGESDLSVVEFVVMIGFTLFLVPMTRNRILSRRESALLLGAYLAFNVYSFMSGSVPAS